ncbi:MAG: hypothetical protein ACI9P5_004192 [Saprospiraceae bacterium]
MDNEITIRDEAFIRTIVFRSTNGFVDYFRVFITTNPEFSTEGIFVRDAYDNIKSISFYESNATDYIHFIYEYTYSDFEESIAIPAVFNPVLFGVFMIFISLII